MVTGWFLLTTEPLEETLEANSTLTLAGFSFGIHFPPRKLPQVGHLGGLCLVTYVKEQPGLVHVPWPRRVYVVVCKEESESESTPQPNLSQVLVTIITTRMPGGYQLAEGQATHVIIKSQVKKELRYNQSAF